jgi:hypothetical protein
MIRSLSANSLSFDSTAEITFRARVKLSEDAAQDATNQVMDSFRRAVEQDRAAGSRAQETAGAEIPVQAGSGEQGNACAEGFLGHRLCAANRLPVEGAA